MSRAALPGQERPCELGVATHLAALEAVIGPPAGLRIVDIGCGEGALARALAERGAEVTGIDPFIEPHPWTEAGPGRFRILRAGGEALPLADGGMDLALFIFSLHHLPMALLPTALDETRRVLGPAGRLYVAEPLAEGPHHELVSSFHDESAVRAEAAAILAREAPRLFARHRRFAYTDRREYPGFDGFAARMIANRRFNGYETEDVLADGVRRRFTAIAARTGGVFDQPVRVDVFEDGRAAPA